MIAAKFFICYVSKLQVDLTTRSLGRQHCSPVLRGKGSCSAIDDLGNVQGEAIETPRLIAHVTQRQHHLEQASMAV